MEITPVQLWWRRLSNWIKKQYDIPVTVATNNPVTAAKGDTSTADPVAQARLSELPARVCPFCGTRDIPQDPKLSIPEPVWRCGCGALASGGWLPDLDDVADHLLWVLNIKGSVSEPPVPTNDSLISIQRYDVEKTERELPKILQGNGYEFRTVCESPSWRAYWVKPKDKALDFPTAAP